MGATVLYWWDYPTSCRPLPAKDQLCPQLINCCDNHKMSLYFHKCPLGVELPWPRITQVTHLVSRKRRSRFRERMGLSSPQTNKSKEGPKPHVFWPWFGFYQCSIDLCFLFKNSLDSIISTIYWNKPTLCIWRFCLISQSVNYYPVWGDGGGEISNYLTGRNQRASVLLHAWRVLSESQNTQFPSRRLCQHTFLETSQARQFDSLILRIQTEKPKLFLLWLHLRGDSDRSKWRSGVSHSVQL